jgi:hypothetical protein
MKKKNINRLKISDKNISIKNKNKTLSEVMKESYVEVVANDLEINEASSAGAALKGGLSKLGKSIGTLGKVITTSFKKLFDVTVVYAKDLIVAWWKGESFSAIHRKRSEKQRILTTELKGLVNSMEGVSELNSFVNIVAPHANILSVVVNNSGKAEAYLEGVSKDGKKGYNALLKSACKKLGIDPPSYVLADTGDTRTNIGNNKILYCNALLKLFYIIDGKYPHKKLSDENIKGRSLDSSLTEPYRQIAKSIQNFVKDSIRISTLKRFIEGELTVTSKSDGKSKSISINRDTENIYSLLFKKDISASSIKDLFYTDELENVISAISGLTNILESLRSNYDFDNKDILFKGNKSNAGNNINNKNKADDESEVVDEKSDDTSESVTRKTSKLKFKNSFLIKEENDETSESENDEIRQEVIARLAEVFGKSVYHIYNSILFNDIYLMTYFYCLNIESSLMYIQALNNLIDIHVSFVENKKIDASKLNVQSLNLEETTNKIIKIKETISNIISSVDFEKIDRFVPDLKNSKSFFEKVLKDSEGNADYYANKLKEITLECSKNAELILKEESKEDISKDDADYIKSLNLCFTFLNSLADFNGSTLEKDVKAAASAAKNPTHEEIVNLYLKDKEDAATSDDIVNACINEDKINSFNNIKKRIVQIEQNIGTADFAKKIADNITKIGKQLDEGVLNIEKEEDSNQTQSDNSQEATDTTTDTETEAT